MAGLDDPRAGRARPGFGLLRWLPLVLIIAFAAASYLVADSRGRARTDQIRRNQHTVRAHQEQELAQLFGEVRSLERTLQLNRGQISFLQQRQDAQSGEATAARRSLDRLLADLAETGALISQLEAQLTATRSEDSSRLPLLDRLERERLELEKTRNRLQVELGQQSAKLEAAEVEHARELDLQRFRTESR
jgi:chromosome segregation ATPase